MARLPVTRSRGAALEPRESVATTDRDGLRILLVEDTKAVAEIFAMMLEKLGHEVLVATDGEAALLQLAESRPDAVFSDISMPGMDGYDLAKRVRQLPECDQVWLVAVTAYDQPEVRDRAHNAGFDQLLVKPPDIDQLESLIASIAARRDAARKPR